MSRRKKKNRSPGSCSLSETSAPPLAQDEEREPEPNSGQPSSSSSDNESEEQYNCLSSSMDNITTVLQETSEETKSQTELNSEKFFKLIILGQETQNKELNEEVKILKNEISHLKDELDIQGVKTSELYQTLQKTESFNNRLQINLNSMENNAELLKIELAEVKDESEKSSRLNILLKEKIGREMQLYQDLNERFKESESQRQKMIKEKFRNSIVIGEYNHNTGQHEDSSLCPERKEIYNKLAVANFKLKRAESKTLKASSALFFCFLCFSLYFYYLKPSENPFDEILRLKSEREELSDEINKLRQKIIFQSVALLCCVPLAVWGLHIWGLILVLVYIFIR